MSFKLENGIDVGTPAWDETRGVGPQADGLAYAKVANAEVQKKSKVYQIVLEFEAQGPGARKGETFKAWENIQSLTNDAKTKRACNENVVKLMGAAFENAVDESGKLAKAIPAGFDIVTTLLGKTMPVYTFAGTDAYEPEVKILTQYQGKKVEAGELTITAQRRARNARNNGRINTVAGNEVSADDVFGGGPAITGTNNSNDTAADADPWA